MLIFTEVHIFYVNILFIKWFKSVHNPSIPYIKELLQLMKELQKTCLKARTTLNEVLNNVRESSLLQTKKGKIMAELPKMRCLLPHRLQRLRR